MLTIDAIKKEVKPLAEKYKIRKVDLFGSYAANTATEKSDADFLVEFNAPIPSIFSVMGFREELENRLNYPVDVVTLPITKKGMIEIDKVVNIYEYER